jgi:hypothetical protein
VAGEAGREAARLRNAAGGAGSRFRPYSSSPARGLSCVIREASWRYRLHSFAAAGDVCAVGRPWVPGAGCRFRPHSSSAAEVVSVVGRGGLAVPASQPCSHGGGGSCSAYLRTRWGVRCAVLLRRAAGGSRCPWHHSGGEDCSPSSSPLAPSHLRTNPGSRLSCCYSHCCGCSPRAC